MSREEKGPSPEADLLANHARGHSETTKPVIKAKSDLGSKDDRLAAKPNIKDDNSAAGESSESLPAVGLTELFQFADRLDKGLIAGEKKIIKISQNI